VISPLLANICLHYVFDLWAECCRRREAAGDMIIVRFADDIVAGFEHENDARRFWDAMRARLEEFSLSLHREMARLIEFGRRAAARRAQRGLGKPETFKFLGFTFICGRSRRGNFLLTRQSWRDRMRATIPRRHAPAISVSTNPGLVDKLSVSLSTRTVISRLSTGWIIADAPHVLRKGTGRAALPTAPSPLGPASRAPSGRRGVTCT
jgi:hypothetical protein